MTDGVTGIALTVRPRVRSCVYCGAPIGPNPRAVTCRAHSDLPALEPLDDRYLLTDTERRG